MQNSHDLTKKPKEGENLEKMANCVRWEDNVATYCAKIISAQFANSNRMMTEPSKRSWEKTGFINVELRFLFMF